MFQKFPIDFKICDWECCCKDEIPGLNYFKKFKCQLSDMQMIFIHCDINGVPVLHQQKKSKSASSSSSSSSDDSSDDEDSKPANKTLPNPSPVTPSQPKMKQTPATVPRVVSQTNIYSFSSNFTDSCTQFHGSAYSKHFLLTITILRLLCKCLYLLSAEYTLDSFFKPRHDLYFDFFA